MATAVKCEAVKIVPAKPDGCGCDLVEFLLHGGVTFIRVRDVLRATTLEDAGHPALCVVHIGETLLAHFDADWKRRDAYEALRAAMLGETTDRPQLSSGTASSTCNVLTARDGSEQVEWHSCKAVGSFQVRDIRELQTFDKDEEPPHVLCVVLGTELLHIYFRTEKERADAYSQVRKAMLRVQRVSA